MEVNENNYQGRDYSSISPSAKALLLLKGYTNIPFAREAAAQMQLPEKYEPDFTIADFRFWARVAHFETRYWSIDQLLADLPIKNILEISSGFSFRGLAAVQHDGVHYIDTDLPEIVEMKKEFVKAIRPSEINPKSKFEIHPLNVLNKQAFQELVSRFPAGEPIVIVNEGLLMYLGNEEKKQLCEIIREILEERGGYWITADIYIKQRAIPSIQADDELNEFFEQHRIREQMFDSFEAAKIFFEAQGFRIDKKAVRDPGKLSAIGYLLKSASEEQLKLLQSAGKIRETWRL